jgi:hypothetical protein
MMDFLAFILTQIRERGSRELRLPPLLRPYGASMHLKVLIIVLSIFDLNLYLIEVVIIIV